MSVKVIKIHSETTIQIEFQWHFFNLKGSLVKIAGLLPGPTNKQKENIEAISTLLLNKYIDIEKEIYITGNILTAFVKYKGKLVQQYFPERCLPEESFIRWDSPGEKEIIKKVTGGIPVHWENPIKMMDPSTDPFFRNIPYPVKRWEKDYDRLKTLADKLFSDTHFNKNELNRWFDKLIFDPRREAATIFEGERGIGKSWFISKKLMDLPEDQYHVIIIDLRFVVTDVHLTDALHFEFGLFFNYYLKNLIWLYPEFKNIYGLSFDPSDPKIYAEMINKNNSLDIFQKNLYRFNYYTYPNSPTLIIAFDNIDQFTESEQGVVLDYCRRLAGGKAGINIIFTIRPQTATIKDRISNYFGDSNIKYVHIKCANIYDIITKRLIYNRKGEERSLDSLIPGTNISWNEVLKIYRRSDNYWGLAGFIRTLCSTSSLIDRPVLEYSFEYHSIDYGNDYKNKLDIRYYLSLFRRVLRSDCLDNFLNIDKLYYGIHALMIRDEGRMEEAESYLFNLFDNEEPLISGNALIRYRVLEYFKTIQTLDITFDQYFDALGCGADNARKVVEMFVKAGLIEISYKRENEIQIPDYGVLTVPGERHYEIVTNLWYIICIKTGMNIYSKCILYNHEAIEKAKEFIKDEKLLKYYGNHGWVSENDFINFLADQENLEDFRIGEFEKNNPDLAEKLSRIFQYLSRPSINIYYSYYEQLTYWRNKQEKRWEKR